MFQSACGRPLMHEVQSSITVETAPTAEPLTLAEVRLHCRREADYLDEDSLFETLIAAAREMVETDSERALMEQTLILSLDQFPDVIELRRCPVGDPDDIEIEYTDTAGATQTLDSDLYRVDSQSEPGRIAPAYGQAWPSVRSEMNAVRVTFPAGYASAAAVPAKAKQAMLLLIGHWYEHREDVGSVGKEIEQGYTALVSRLKWGGYP